MGASKPAKPAGRKITLSNVPCAVTGPADEIGTSTNAIQRRMTPTIFTRPVTVGELIQALYAFPGICEVVVLEDGEERVLTTAASLDGKVTLTIR